MTLPGSDDTPGHQAGFEAEEPPEERIRNFMPRGGPVADKLVEVAKADRTFDPEQFLQGAKSAYEMVVTAFAEGNRRSLKQLLSKEVYEGFVSAMDERDRRDESVDTSFIGINKADIIDAEMKDRDAHVTVKFISQMITAIRNRQGEVIEGDPKKVREVTDIWTFARDVTSRDPNWKLVATQSSN